MNPESSPYRMLAFLVAVIIVVVAAVLAWNMGTRTSLAKTPPIQPKLSLQPSELEKYKGQPGTPPPAEPLAKTDQNASPPPAEPLAKTEQPTLATPPAEPLAQAQNPMQGQSLEGQPYTPLTDQLFIQIAAEMASADGGQSVMPQDSMGLAVVGARVLEKYHVNPMEYYQKAFEVNEGPSAEWYSQQIWARVAQLQRLRAAPQPQAPGQLPATAAPVKKGR